MTFGRRHIAVLSAAMLAAAPAPALAGTVGGATGGETFGGATPTAQDPATEAHDRGAGTRAIGTPVVSASANGITLAVRSAALVHRVARVTGTAPAGLAEIRIEHRHATRGWTAVATAPVADDGAFSVRWRPRAVGVARLRAVVASTASSGASTAPQVDVTVYRTGVASWYGPGFWGRKTACGVTLRRKTIGVAHRTLPCGTQVRLVHGGRMLTVPVIDRGPFTAGRTWDLTKAAHAALGAVGGLLTVGAQPLTAAPRLRTPFQAPPIRLKRR